MKIELKTTCLCNVPLILTDPDSPATCLTCGNWVHSWVIGDAGLKIHIITSANEFEKRRYDMERERKLMALLPPYFPKRLI